MKIFHLEDIGPHYARTLATWRRNFFEQLPEVRALGYPDSFVRMWEFYLCYCEGGFAERQLGDVQLLLTKPGCRRAPLAPPAPPRAPGMRGDTGRAIEREPCSRHRQQRARSGGVGALIGIRTGSQADGAHLKSITVTLSVAMPSRRAAGRVSEVARLVGWCHERRVGWYRRVATQAIAAARPR